MEVTVNLNLLQTISFIYDEAKGSKLSPELFEKLDQQLEKLSSYFHVSKNQAFLLANIFVFNYKGDTVDINDLGKYFECNPVKLLEHHNDLVELAEKGILKKRKSRHRLIAIANDQFFFEEFISTAIIMNQQMPKLKRTSCPDVIEVLEKLYQLGQERDDGIISTVDLFQEMKRIMESNEQFPLIKKVKQMAMDDADTYLFSYLCWKTITGNQITDLNRTADGIFDNPGTKVLYTQRLIAKENDLIKNGWVEIEEAVFFNDTGIKLTEQSTDLLVSENIKLFSKKTKWENVIKPEEIGHKLLFYNTSEKQQFSILAQMLQDENLKQLQSRLVEKVMPSGITVLLYGSPGTGKTESVFQIAKETGREIMRVEISQAKSMWFGESEKIIKRIFTNYNEFSKHSERSPILLFNEADAIISKRKENSESNVKQTENAIQNILLEELENFKGILFATTNLANNLDKAFERRFLFKVQFSKPDAAIRSEIWKSKLKSATAEECNMLADKFDFSGGQIENIVRKCEISEVLNGKSPDILEIIVYCEEELISKDNRPKIGFSTSQKRQGYTLV